MISRETGECLRLTEDFVVEKYIDKEGLKAEV